MYLCVGFASDSVQRQGPSLFDAIRGSAIRDGVMLPLDVVNIVGFLSYGRDGLLVGNVLIPREKCVVSTITKSRIKFGLLPAGRHALMPVHFTNRAGAREKGRSVLSTVLTIMDERSPEVRFEAFGVGGEDVYISLSGDAVISNGGAHPVELTLRLCGRMSNIYFAEALARVGDCSLLSAYLKSYVDALCVYAIGREKNPSGLEASGALSKVSVFLDTLPISSLDGGNYSSPARSGASQTQINKLLWLLRVDHVCHGILDTIGEYCGEELNPLQLGVLRVLTDYVNKAELRCPIKNNSHAGKHVIELLQMVRRQNFPFSGDTSYTRALKNVEGFNSNRSSYSERSTCRLDGVMLIDVPACRRRKSAVTSTWVDADVSAECAFERVESVRTRGER
ncbi:MAG: hypothetical protein AB8U44_00885 [Aaplasma endosymbiont of Hyalomma asiaticum]